MRISLHQIELCLSLGVTEAERLQTQTILVDIDIDFPTPPVACITDQLEDTYCYDVLTQHISKKIMPKTFYLLEHLAHEIYQLVKSASSQPITVNVKVTKKPRLLTALTLGSASICYGDS